MLRLMLNAHSCLAIPFELDFLAAMDASEDDFDASRVLKRLAEHPWTHRARIEVNEEEILKKRPRGHSELFREVFGQWAAAQGKIRWGNKTPTYVTELDRLYTLFPDSQFIHIVRDGRDVAVSLGALSWGSRHIPRVAADWRWKTILARKMGNILDRNYLEVHYESLVARPRETLEGICDFLGLPYEHQMLSYPKTATDALPEDSLKWHQSSISPPDISKIGIWRDEMSYADKYIFEDIAGDALALFGYDRLSLASTMGTRAKSLYYDFVRRW
jgi:hypothetical protein